MLIIAAIYLAVALLYLGLWWIMPGLMEEAVLTVAGALPFVGEVIDGQGIIKNLPIFIISLTISELLSRTDRRELGFLYKFLRDLGISLLTLLIVSVVINSLDLGETRLALISFIIFGGVLISLWAGSRHWFPVTFFTNIMIKAFMYFVFISVFGSLTQTSTLLLGLALILIAAAVHMGLLALIRR